MLVRILCKNLLSWKWFEIVEKMLDRWIWKPKNDNENNLNINWDIIIKLPE
jgi:hypothetical protein